MLAERMFGIDVSRQSTGLVLTAAGLLLLTLTLPGAAGDHASFSAPMLTVFEAALFAVGVLLIVSPRLGGPPQHHGLMVAAAAGILFGVCNVAASPAASPARGCSPRSPPL